MDASTLLAGILFGAVGTVALIYGKKQSEWKPAVIGIVLMAYPYFVTNSVLQWLIGAVLTAALFIFR